MPVRVDLARLYSIPRDETDRLVELARTANAEVNDTRLVIQRGNTLAMQQRWRAMEADAKVVRSFQPAVVLGGLQVPSYTAVIMGEPVDFAVATGFHIYDESAVVVGLVVAAATLSEDADVVYFRELFEQLGALAVFGEETRQELRRLRASYR